MVDTTFRSYTVLSSGYTLYQQIEKCGQLLVSEISTYMIEKCRQLLVSEISTYMCMHHLQSV